MTSRLAERQGVQLPRLEVRPPAASGSWGEEFAALAAECGVYLDPWQRYVLDVGLAENDGLFAALLVVLLVARQNGKTAILAAFILGCIALLEDELVLYSAHQFKTTKETFRLVDKMVRAGPLRGLWKKNRESGVETAVEFKSGARVIFVARSGSSGRGFTANKLVLDEGFSLRQAMLGALIPTMSAMPNPQVWVASSAPMRDSDALHQIRARAMSDNPGRLALMEWSVVPGTASDDRDGWARSNPALGYRITERFIEDEHDALSAEEFDRERLGIGESPAGTAELSPISVEDWGRLVDTDSEPTGRLVYGLAVSVDRQHASIGVAAPSTKGGLHVELVAAGAGTGWVVESLVGILARHGGAAVAVDPGSPAGSLVGELERALAPLGVELIKMSARDHAAACGALVDRVSPPDGHAPGVRHIGQVPVGDAVAGAKKRNLADAWALDRKKPDVDISPLESIVMALGGVLRLPDEVVEDSVTVYEERGFVEW